MKRIEVLHLALALSLLSWPVQAQTAPTTDAPANAAPAPAQPAAPAAAPSAAPAPDGAAKAPEAADAAKAAAPPPKPVPPSLVARIDLSSQTMTVSENGVAKYSWAISSGTSGYATPTGSYRPVRTEKVWFSRQYDNAPMHNAVFFYKGYAVHGTQAVNSLGRPASHGCVRLAPGNASMFYKLVQKHGLGRTKISLSGKPKWRAAPEVASRQAPPSGYYGWGSPPPPSRQGRYAPNPFFSNFDGPGDYYAPKRQPRGKRYVSRGYSAN